MLRPLKKRPVWPPGNEITHELFEMLLYLVVLFVIDNSFFVHKSGGKQ